MWSRPIIELRVPDALTAERLRTVVSKQRRSAHGTTTAVAGCAVSFATVAASTDHRRRRFNNGIFFKVKFVCASLIKLYDVPQDDWSNSRPTAIRRRFSLLYTIRTKRIFVISPTPPSRRRRRRSRTARRTGYSRLPGHNVYGYHVYRCRVCGSVICDSSRLSFRLPPAAERIEFRPVRRQASSAPITSVMFIVIDVLAWKRRTNRSRRRRRRRHRRHRFTQTVPMQLFLSILFCVFGFQTSSGRPRYDRQ